MIVLPGAARRALRLPHVARPQGRRAWRAPTASACSPRTRSRRRRRPRPTRCSASRAARRPPSAPRTLEAPDTHRQRGPRPDAPRGHRGARHHRRRRASSPSSSARRSRSRPTRWSRPTRPRRPGTSSGCRRSSPTPRSASARSPSTARSSAACCCRALLLALLTAWPWLDRSPAGAAGAWFAASRRRQNVVFLVVVPLVLVLHRHRHLLPRPLLALLLALGSLARDSHEDLTMEKRTDSPYPRRDRPVLAVVGVLLVVSTVLFAWSDREHDWRYYQYEFKHQVAEKFGAEKAADGPLGHPADLGARRCGRADRCVTCHQATLLEGLRDGGGAVPHPSGRAAQGRTRSRSSAAPPATAARAGPSTPRRRTARSSTGRSRCSARQLGEAYSLVRRTRRRSCR